MTSDQGKFDAWSRALKASALGQPRGMGWEGGVQAGGTHVHPWIIHVDIWQKPPQYFKEISFQLKWINQLKKDYQWNSQQKSFRWEGSGMIYSKCWMRKNLPNTKVISRKTVLQNWRGNLGVIDKQKLRELITLDLN